MRREDDDNNPTVKWNGKILSFVKSETHSRRAAAAAADDESVAAAAAHDNDSLSAGSH
jgi:hypothetical protein